MYCGNEIGNSFFGYYYKQSNNSFKKMEKRVCKNSSLEFSILGTGCWAFGGGEYWGDQN